MFFAEKLMENPEVRCEEGDLARVEVCELGGSGSREKRGHLP